jgi:hypothetical protein
MLKCVLLVLLIINFVIQTIEAYDYILRDSQPIVDKAQLFTELEKTIPKADPTTKRSALIKARIPAQSTPPRMKRAPVVSSNVLMVWRDPKNKNKFLSHNIDHKSFEKLEAEAKSMSHKDIKELMEVATRMSTQDFLAFINNSNFKDQLYAMKRISETEL